MKNGMKAGIVVFPGSNCDRDCYRALKAVTGVEARFVWHRESSLEDFDLIILPGGFSFGDYLRTGAIARFSPVMNEVIRLGKRGVRLLGICNGFQILAEAGLLPGALLRNQGLLFICKDIYMKVERSNTDFTNKYEQGQVLRMPVIHGEGNYTIDEAGYHELVDGEQVIFRYCASDGSVNPSDAPNGAMGNIAGIINREGNILGLMPHPEKVSEPIMGGEDGAGVFRSLLSVLSV
ncbi:MAG: phosphoribosylformylglycinamidine synthase subunit PurQ [Synergistaceae bacterium]|jgi:phosphoribosylformylglycinamidine synthase|nr:phosphoribosylformylglycinamidine synthase subunit PurQ [Synergistaceae bacterium]